VFSSRSSYVLLKTTINDIPHAITSYGRRSFAVTGPTEWNKLLQQL